MRVAVVHKADKTRHSHEMISPRKKQSVHLRGVVAP